MKLQHYIGGLENVGPVLFERKVFVEPWETQNLRYPCRHDGLELATAAARYAKRLPHSLDWADLRKGARSAHSIISNTAIMRNGWAASQAIWSRTAT